MDLNPLKSNRSQLRLIRFFEILSLYFHHRYREYERDFNALISIQGKPIRRPLPIVCMSASSDPETRSLALSIGMNGFIDKPFKIKELAVFFDLTKD